MWWQTYDRTLTHAIHPTSVRLLCGGCLPTRTCNTFSWVGNSEVGLTSPSCTTVTVGCSMGIANTMAGTNPDAIATTIRIANLAGDFGRNEHLLPAAAFVQAFFPLVVFFGLQRFFVRGILAGSVKG